MIFTRRQILVASLLPAFPALPAFAQEKSLPPAFLKPTFDTGAVSRLLDLQAAKDDSDTAIDSLLDLPAYRNIARIGEKEGATDTREQLARSAKAVIRGEATAQSQPRADAARLYISNPAVYRAMLKEVEATGAARSARITAHLSVFTPAKVLSGEPLTATVYLHLGGTWDALNVNGDIFLNLHYWAEYNRPALDGLNLVVAHEAMHSVQTKAFGNPELQDDGAGAFLTALSKIQREGTARYIETSVDPDSYREYTYGFFYRAVATEAVRDFPRLPRLLEPLYAACFPAFDKERFVEIYSRGMNNGGDFYALGHGAAQAIDRVAGRAALIETVEKGPKSFWTRYADASNRDKTLPTLPDTISSYKW